MTLQNNVIRTKIPGYSVTQEMFNSISHFIGIPLYLLICGLGMYFFSNGQIRLLDFFGYFIFAVSALIVYFVSGIYHLTPKDSPKKKNLRILDHCTIYLLIAGTYTPVCFHLMREGSPIHLGIIMLSIEWIGVIVGFILNAFFFQSKASRIISFILYVVMGWLALICGAIFQIYLYSAVLILAGGIVYTIGSILYACGHGWKWFHFIFHLFVLAGTITQAIGIFLLH